MKESLMNTSSGMLPEVSGIKYVDLLILLAQDNYTHLFGAVFETLLGLDLQHWTLFTNMEYPSIIIENLCSNYSDFLKINNPNLIGKMLSKRPLRNCIISALKASELLKRLREDSENLTANIDLAMVLHKQLIYYPEDFPEATQ